MNRPQLREALARGYCTEENKFKILDSVLIESMIDQLIGEEDA